MVKLVWLAGKQFKFSDGSYILEVNQVVLKYAEQRYTPEYPAAMFGRCPKPLRSQGPSYGT